MTAPLDDLLDPADPDWLAYQNGDPEFILRATGDTIRAYCGWHISPNITQTVEKLDIGSQGLILLRSLYVTDVAEVYTQPNPDYDQALMDSSDYVWHQEGYIEPVSTTSWRSAWGYYYEPGPVFMPSSDHGLATVTFSHGYDELPDDIKMVAYELAGWATQVGPGGAGTVKEIASPGFRLVTGGSNSLGMNLNADQKNRLAPYRIGGVK